MYEHGRVNDRRLEGEYNYLIWFYIPKALKTILSKSVIMYSTSAADICTCLYNHLQCCF